MDAVTRKGDRRLVPFDADQRRFFIDESDDIIAVEGRRSAGRCIFGCGRTGQEAKGGKDSRYSQRTLPELSGARMEKGPGSDDFRGLFNLLR